MTENEVISGLEILRNQCKHHGECGSCEICYDAVPLAIQALEEIQRYRAIGTVEELQALKEKSVAKKPLLRLCGDCQRGCVDCDRYEDRCPTCNGGLYVESGKSHDFCPHCGQAIDWQ